MNCIAGSPESHKQQGHRPAGPADSQVGVVRILNFSTATEVLQGKASRRSQIADPRVGEHRTNFFFLGFLVHLCCIQAS